MSDKKEPIECDTCDSREYHPADYFQDDGKTFDDPDFMDEDCGHLTMTYHDTCEFCEHDYSYTVYAKIHTIEFESDREEVF